MSYKVSGQVTDEHKHREDVECCVYTNGRLYTGSDDGVIKVTHTVSSLVCSV